MERNQTQTLSRAASEVIDRFPNDDREHRRVRRLVFRDTTVPDEKLAEILPMCPRLESLVLCGVPNLTEETLLLVVGARNLHSLDLTGCKNITDAGILALVDGISSFRALRLSGVAALTDRAVSAIARSCLSLEELELSDLPSITSVSVRDVWSYLRRLRVFKLAHCPHLTDRAFPAAIHGATRIASPPTDRPSIPAWQADMSPLVLTHTAENLRFLDLANCTTLTDEGIAGIVAHAPELQTLIVSGCVALTDSAVASISKLGLSLETLTLSHLANTTDHAIIGLARSCSNLMSLDVAFCRHLTDMSIFEIACLPGLRTLSLIRVQNLTDNAIDALTDYVATIESLDISFCDNLSLDSVFLLLQRCSLRYLNATGVPSFRRKGVRRFSDPPPSDWAIEQKSAFRVFRSENIAALRRFLEKEHLRRKEAELRNIKFTARADDKLDLF